MVRLIPHVDDHRQLSRLHLLRDLFHYLRRGRLVGQRVDNDLAVLARIAGPGANRTAPRAVRRQQVVRRCDDECVAGEVRPPDLFHEVPVRGVRLVEQPDAGGHHFPQIVRQDVCRHADGNAGAAVQQHDRNARGQQSGFVDRAVEVRSEIHRALPDFGQQQFGVFR